MKQKGKNIQHCSDATDGSRPTYQWYFTNLIDEAPHPFRWCRSRAAHQSQLCACACERLSLNIHEERQFGQSDASELMRRVPHVPVMHRERERCCWSRCGTSADVTEVNKPNLLLFLLRFLFLYCLFSVEHY